MRSQVWFKLILTFLLSLCLIGCDSANDDFVFQIPQQAAAPPVPMGVISGRIVASNTGNPIQGAQVVANIAVVPRADGLVLGRDSGNDTTDANGDFSIGELDPGTYTFQCTANGRQLFQQQVLVEEDKTSTVNVSMWPTPGGVLPFQSYAYDLVDGDTNDSNEDVFLRDLTTNTTTKISNAAAGSGGHSDFPVLSDSEAYLVFASRGQLLDGESDSNPDVYRYDVVNGTLANITSPLGAVDMGACDYADLHPFTAGTGMYTVFEWPSTLYSEKTVYLHDASDNSLTPISLPPTGNPDGCSKRPAINSQETVVFFDSRATNLLADDTNTCRDIFRYDIATGDLALVTRAANGDPTNECSRWPSCSADGNYLAFESDATNLVTSPVTTTIQSRIYVRDLTTGTNELISVTSNGDASGSSGCFRPTITADGRYVAFYTSESLVPEDTNGSGDIYVRDRVSNTTVLVSADSMGNPGDLWSYNPVIASDGSFVYYSSQADNLVSGVTASVDYQVISTTLSTLAHKMLSLNTTASPGNDASYTRD